MIGVTPNRQNGNQGSDTCADVYLRTEILSNLSPEPRIIDVVGGNHH